jgi:hypothetical protein
VNGSHKVRGSIPLISTKAAFLAVFRLKVKSKKAALQEFIYSQIFGNILNAHNQINTKSELSLSFNLFGHLTGLKNMRIYDSPIYGACGFDK